MAILEELICLWLVSGDTSEKQEAATLKLGSIEIEENLTEESPEAPWWAKLKKKHGNMTEDEEEGSTTEPTYSTFSWVEETPGETSTTTTTRPSTIFATSPASPTSSSAPSKPDMSSAMTESTTKGTKKEVFFLVF